MNYEYSIGEIVWHGRRYWKSSDLKRNEVYGWNAEYVPYEITRILPKRIEIANWQEDGLFYLNREQMEKNGLQYHTRVHEYFFRVRPRIVGDYIGRAVEALQGG